MTDISIRIHAFIMGLVSSVRAGEKGQDLIEYAMLGGLIALGILGVGLLFTDEIESMISGIGNCIDFDNSSACNAGF